MGPYERELTRKKMKPQLGRFTLKTRLSCKTETGQAITYWDNLF